MTLQQVDVLQLFRQSPAVAHLRGTPLVLECGVQTHLDGKSDKQPYANPDVTLFIQYFIARLTVVSKHAPPTEHWQRTRSCRVDILDLDKDQNTRLCASRLLDAISLQFAKDKQLQREMDKLVPKQQQQPSDDDITAALEGTDSKDAKRETVVINLQKLSIYLGFWELVEATLLSLPIGKPIVLDSSWPLFVRQLLSALPLRVLTQFGLQFLTKDKGRNTSCLVPVHPSFPYLRLSQLLWQPAQRQTARLWRASRGDVLSYMPANEYSKALRCFDWEANEGIPFPPDAESWKGQKGANVLRFTTNDAFVSFLTFQLWRFLLEHPVEHTQAVGFLATAIHLICEPPSTTVGDPSHNLNAQRFTHLLPLMEKFDRMKDARLPFMRLMSEIVMPLWDLLSNPKSLATADVLAALAFSTRRFGDPPDWGDAVQLLMPPRRIHKPSCWTRDSGDRIPEADVEAIRHLLALHGYASVSDSVATYLTDLGDQSEAFLLDTPDVLGLQELLKSALDGSPYENGDPDEDRPPFHPDFPSSPVLAFLLDPSANSMQHVLVAGPRDAITALNELQYFRLFCTCTKPEEIAAAIGSTTARVSCFPRPDILYRWLVYGSDNNKAASLHWLVPRVRRAALKVLLHLLNPEREQGDQHIDEKAAEGLLDCIDRLYNSANDGNTFVPFCVVCSDPDVFFFRLDFFPRVWWNWLAWLFFLASMPEASRNARIAALCGRFAMDNRCSFEEERRELEGMVKKLLSVFGGDTKIGVFDALFDWKTQMPRLEEFLNKHSVHGSSAFASRSLFRKDTISLQLASTTLRQSGGSAAHNSPMCGQLFETGDELAVFVRFAMDYHHGTLDEYKCLHPSSEGNCEQSPCLTSEIQIAACRPPKTQCCCSIDYSIAAVRDVGGTRFVYPGQEVALPVHTWKLRQAHQDSPVDRYLQNLFADCEEVTKARERFNARLDGVVKSHSTVSESMPMETEVPEYEALGMPPSVVMNNSGNVTINMFQQSQPQPDRSASSPEYQPIGYDPEHADSAMSSLTVNQLDEVQKTVAALRPKDVADSKAAKKNDDRIRRARGRSAARESVDEKKKKKREEEEKKKREEEEFEELRRKERAEWKVNEKLRLEAIEKKEAEELERRRIEREAAEKKKEEERERRRIEREAAEKKEAEDRERRRIEREAAEKKKEEERERLRVERETAEKEKKREKEEREKKKRLEDEERNQQKEAKAREKQAKDRAAVEAKRREKLASAASRTPVREETRSSSSTSRGTKRRHQDAEERTKDKPEPKRRREDKEQQQREEGETDDTDMPAADASPKPASENDMTDVSVANASAVDPGSDLYFVDLPDSEQK